MGYQIFNIVVCHSKLDGAISLSSQIFFIHVFIYNIQRYTRIGLCIIMCFKQSLQAYSAKTFKFAENMFIKR